MGKNIETIHVDPILQEWLLEKLMRDPPKSDCAKDLLSGIYAMRNGMADSLLLSTSQDAGVSVAESMDEIRIGGLVINQKKQESVQKRRKDRFDAEGIRHSVFPG